MYKQFPDVIEKLRDLNSRVAGGTTAVVALFHHKKLYVANVGTLLKVLGQGQVLKVVW